MTIEKPKQRQENEDRSAFQIGEKVGEGGQRDILSDTAESPDEEFTGMAKTGEQGSSDGVGVKEEQDA
ncbi:hypothetical protein [Sphingosinicella sp.]|uniref:hypothetical protein n=1 Tax=Sphingosinicella sp. TaxID=1917971 RepID=UPI00403776FF